MNGNLTVNGNGHQNYNVTSKNNDTNINGHASVNSSNSTEQSLNKFGQKSTPQHLKMATNGNATSSKEETENSFVDVTRSKILGITSYSSKLEEILLALLQQQQADREKMDGINKRIDDEKIEREKGLNNLSDRLSTEVRDREEVNEAVTDALQELSKQLEENVIQLDGKMDEIKAGSEDAKEAMNQGLSELEDKLGRKISDSTNDLSSKYDEKLDKNLANLSNQIEEKLDNKLLDLKSGIDEMEKNVVDALENEKADREKLAGDTKMALEEEKMLRAQDIGIIRDKLDDQNNNIKDLVNKETSLLKDTLDDIKNDVDKANGGIDQEIAELKSALNDEIKTRSEENELLNGTFGTKVEDLQRKTNSLEEIVDSENAVRKQEALDLKERLEREKQQLQEYIEKDNAALRDKLDKENKIIKEKMDLENEQRRKENEELQNKLQKENESIQAKIEGESKLLKDQLDQEKRNLHQQLEAGNNAREALQKQLEEDKQNIADKIERENQQIRDRIKAETEGLANKLEGETNMLKENLEKEKMDAKKEQERLEEEMNKGKMTLAEKLRAENAELQERMKREQEERAKKEALMKEEMKKNKEGNKNEILELFERMKKELEEQRAKADEIEKQAREENEKRIKEAQRIQRNRLEDKQKLQNYIARNVEPDYKSSEGKSRLGGNDQSELSESKQSNGSTRNYSLGGEFANSNMSKNGVGNSEDIHRSSNGSSNLCPEYITDDDLSLSAGILQLNDQLKLENEKRRQECKELFDMLAREREKTSEDLLRETSQVRDLMKKDQKARDDEKRFKDKEVQAMQDELNKRNDALEKETASIREKVVNQLEKVALLNESMLSVYFNAVRDEPYLGGGEEYLTFTRCTVNSCLNKTSLVQGSRSTEHGCMDPKSGVFEAPFTGVYLFSLHVCTHDLKKALLSIRKNGGTELASLYDQNHVDNHKNSMVGNSIIVELAAGDRVQVYMYTFTGLHDKPGNRLTQFMGCLLRPLDSLSSNSKESADGSNNLSHLVVPESPRGHRMAMSSERF